MVQKIFYLPLSSNKVKKYEEKTIQEPAVQYFKSTSNLNFAITKLPESKDGIVALAVKTGGNAEKVASALKSADRELCSFFEVELWK